nr:hypothetical protein Iba_chr07aCG6370 [Ipomoea batatas]
MPAIRRRRAPGTSEYESAGSSKGDGLSPWNPSKRKGGDDAGVAFTVTRQRLDRFCAGARISSSLERNSGISWSVYRMPMRITLSYSPPSGAADSVGSGGPLFPWARPIILDIAGKARAVHVSTRDGPLGCSRHHYREPFRLPARPINKALARAPEDTHLPPSFSARASRPSNSLRSEYETVKAAHLEPPDYNQPENYVPKRMAGPSTTALAAKPTEQGMVLERCFAPAPTGPKKPRPKVTLEGSMAPLPVEAAPAQGSESTMPASSVGVAAVADLQVVRPTTWSKRSRP